MWKKITDIIWLIHTNNYVQLIQVQNFNLQKFQLQNTSSLVKNSNNEGLFLFVKSIYLPLKRFSGKIAII